MSIDIITWITDMQRSLRRQFEPFSTAIKAIEGHSATKQLDGIIRITEVQKSLRRQFEPFSTAIKSIEGHSATKQLDSVTRIMEMQKSLRRQLEPFSTAIKVIEGHSATKQFVRDLNRYQELIRIAYGPFEEMRRAYLNLTSQLGGEFERMKYVMTAAEERFLLPGIVELTKLQRELEKSSLSIATKHYQQPSSDLLLAMEAMRTPWLDIANKLQSINGFAKLQGIGHALNTMPVFDPCLTSALCTELGDWRKEINWPSEIFTDPLARTSFYEDRGLNPTLTAFPANTFEQIINIANLKGTLEPLADPYYFETEGEEDEKEAAFERTTEAYKQLQYLETQIRKFIDERMQEVFGWDWIKHQVPGEIRQQWLRKQQKAKDYDEPERLLIAYADFADYVPIIIRKDNWETVFKQTFRRRDFVRESFQRLYPIRNCTMHARLITQDDELYLYVETKRILAAIGIII